VTLDVDAVGALVCRAVADGANGVLVTGTTGEGSLLSPDTRSTVTALARTALDAEVAAGATAHVNGRPFLVAGASGASPAAVQDDVARLAAAGADLVLVLAPSLHPLSPDELADFHLGVADAAEVGTLVYHIPQMTGSSLTPEAVRRLAGHQRIVGMKDSSPDADRRAAFVASTTDRADFSVFTGHAPTLAAAVRAGVVGSITALGNLRLRQVVALHAAVAAGDDEADELQRRLTRLGADVAEVGASTPAVLKAALQLDGVLDERWCSPPLSSVPPNRLDHVRTALLR
jgi:dihydrodipicolinate synthase/N-acetylneuraminate lyase